MLVLQSKLQQIGEAYSKSIANSFHYTRPKGLTSFLVWQEDGEGNSFHFDLHGREQGIHGTTDYYTQTEYDENIDTIQAINNSLFIVWRLNSVQYEEDTKFIHYEWEWTVADGEEQSGRV